MRQPFGFEMKSANGTSLVCKLNRVIYSLKQAGREWCQTIVSFLIEIGFTSGHNEPCLFTYHNKLNLTLLAFYVDDIAICSDSQRDLNEIKRSSRKGSN